MKEHKYPYRWTLKDAIFAKDKGSVFSCFACGGGSTMGYKLAGFDVIGCCEIDPRMNKVYVANHHPRFNYLMDIRELVVKAKAHDLPDELYSLDILDGSPPCSSFSTAGSREDGWGKEKKFREGQATQVLDTLFFDFIDLAKELQPKVVIAENVKGLTLGEAKAYMTRIYNEFDNAGYDTCWHLLDASKMGVPQLRERVFFCAVRKDLKDVVPTEGLFGEPFIDMEFDEDAITMEGIVDYKGRRWSENTKIHQLWLQRKEGDRDLGEINLRLNGSQTYFSNILIYPNEVCLTLTAKEDSKLHFHQPCFFSDQENKSVSSFPQDYDFLGEKSAYICGMSVPPVMMAQVASRVYEQWLKPINLTLNMKH